MGRTAYSKDVELLVLRHEVAVLRGTNPRPRMDRADRAIFAALSVGCANAAGRRTESSSEKILSTTGVCEPGSRTPAVIVFLCSTPAAAGRRGGECDDVEGTNNKAIALADASTDALMGGAAVNPRIGKLIGDGGESPGYVGPKRGQ